MSSQSATVASVSERMDAADEVLARKVAKLTLRALIWTIAVVTLYCKTNTQREAWELMWVAGVVILGSLAVDHICRMVGPRTRR